MLQVASRVPGMRVRSPALSRLTLACLVVLVVLVTLGDPAGAARRPYTLDNDPLRLGNKALAAGQLDEARIRFEEAVANDHQLPEAFFGLARVASRQGRYDDAEAACHQALAAAGGTFPRARATLGLLLLRSGRDDAARDELAQALDEDPELWEAHYGLARLLLDTGDLAGARRHLESGRDRRGRDEGEDLYRHGEALLREADGDLEGAERAALQAATINPEDPEHGALLARLYAVRGYDALAISKYEEILARPGFSPSASVLHALGRLYAGQRRFNDASDLYLRAVTADSTYAPAVLDLAELFRLAKRWDKAAGTYLRYVALVPADAAARRALAGTLYELGRFGEAATAARAAVELDSRDSAAKVLFVRAGLRAAEPEVATAAAAMMAELPADTPWHADDLLELASHQEAAGDVEGALASLARAGSLAPEQARIPYRIGMIALRSGQRAEAAEAFARATALDSTEAVYPLNLGIARYQAGDAGGALDAFREAVDRDGDMVAARLLLAQALLATGALDEAEREYGRVREREPHNAKALRGIGFCRLRRADYAGAAEVYAEATAAEAEDADGWAGLGGARLGLGDLDGAEQAFARARALDPDNPMLKAGTELLNKARNAGKDSQPK